MTTDVAAAADTWLLDAAAARERAGLRRVLRGRATDESLLDLAGNDYLGLAKDARVVEATIDAVRQWGAGSTSSRLVTGTTRLHRELERALADFGGAEAALVFSSGYAANLGVITALIERDGLIVSDAGNHASLIDACRLSRARVVVTPHLDVGAVDDALSSRPERRALVVTDSVFSVDGDVAPLPELHDACRRHGALLVVDEAHAFGVVGPGGGGLAAAHRLAGAPDVVRTVTLSKALGSQGGALLASRVVVEHVLNTARTFIFDTGLAPACVGAALRAVQILATEPELASRVRGRALDLATGLGAAPPAAAVVSLVLGDPARAVAAADACRLAGVGVGCFRPPSVPAGSSRLRLTARADLGDRDVQRAIEVVLDAIGSVE